MGILIPAVIFNPALHKYPVITAVKAREICEREFDPATHKSPVITTAQAREICEREFDPEIHKVPVTKEYMACALAGKVEVENKFLLEQFSDALYESIAGMIYSLARKYSCTCRDDIADLAQDCSLRIFQKINQYNPEKAKFNTWAWYVASSILNRNYQKTRRYLNRFAEWNDACDNYGETEEMTEMTHDVQLALKELFSLYPEKQDVLSEMFCQEGGEMYVPDRISMRKVATTLGRDYSEVYSFFRNKLRPFLAGKFGGAK